MQKNTPSQSDLVAIRLPQELREKIPKGNLSAFIKDAIGEKLERERDLKICPTCKGIGKVRKK